MARHALLGASSASRWLNCTPSARLCEKCEDTSSTYAAEGTLAHELAERLLSLQLNGNRRSVETVIHDLKTHELFYEGMTDDVDPYVQYVMEQYNAALAKTKDAAIFLEAKVDFSAYVPEGFGTGDCIIIADGEMEIIDLKFGKGVVVSPIDNSQLKLYALGAYDNYGFLYGVDKITMTIAQVRLDNIASWTINADMLEEWAEKDLRPKAKLAFAGKGETLPGEWCAFCKVKSTCRARAESNLAFFQAYNKDKQLLGVEEVAQILARADEIEKWAKEMKDYSLDEALKGAKFPGWKLVEGRSNRKISDEDALACVLLSAGYQEDKIYKPKALEGITNLEKVIGKKKLATIGGAYIEKPPGKPTLAPDSDQRPELDSVETDFDFI